MKQSLPLVEVIGIGKVVHYDNPRPIIHATPKNVKKAVYLEETWHLQSRVTADTLREKRSKRMRKRER